MPKRTAKPFGKKHRLQGIKKYDSTIVNKYVGFPKIAELGVLFGALARLSSFFMEINSYFLGNYDLWAYLKTFSEIKLHEHAINLFVTSLMNREKHIRRKGEEMILRPNDIKLLKVFKTWVDEACIDMMPVAVFATDVVWENTAISNVPDLFTMMHTSIFLTTIDTRINLVYQTTGYLTSCYPYLKCDFVEALTACFNLKTDGLEQLSLDKHKYWGTIRYYEAGVPFDESFSIDADTVLIGKPPSNRTLRTRGCNRITYRNSELFDIAKLMSTRPAYEESVKRNRNRMTPGIQLKVYGNFKMFVTNHSIHPLLIESHYLDIEKGSAFFGTHFVPSKNPSVKNVEIFDLRQSYYHLTLLNFVRRVTLGCALTEKDRREKNQAYAQDMGKLTRIRIALGGTAAEYEQLDFPDIADAPCFVEVHFTDLIELFQELILQPPIYVSKEMRANFTFSGFAHLLKPEDDDDMLNGDRYFTKLLSEFYPTSKPKESSTSE